MIVVIYLRIGTLNYAAVFNHAWPTLLIHQKSTLPREDRTTLIWYSKGYAEDRVSPADAPTKVELHVLESALNS
jgi:hypothetical protein